MSTNGLSKINIHNGINDSLLFGTIQNNEKNYSNHKRMSGNLDKGENIKR